MTEIVWIGVEGNSRERCRVTEAPHGVEIDSEIDAGPGSCSYSLRTTADWGSPTSSSARTDVNSW